MYRRLIVRKMRAMRYILYKQETNSQISQKHFTKGFSMKVQSIEATPNPNTIKLLLDVSLPKGKSYSFGHGEFMDDDVPAFIGKLLDLKGVKDILYFTNFVAVSKETLGEDWEEILIRSQEIINGPGQPIIRDFRSKVEKVILYGEVRVDIQYFREIPMQVKLTGESSTKKLPLSEKFFAAVQQASKSSPNMLLERIWKDVGLRYGKLDDVGETICDELDAVYSKERLEDLANRSFEEAQSQTPRSLKSKPEKATFSGEMSDWRNRFGQLDSLGKDVEKNFDGIVAYISDENTSVRRLAIAFLGIAKSPKAIPLLIESLRDSSVAIRRTAGDCLSDIGSKKAIPAMIESLKDKSRIVRWRSARYLYEVGDVSALSALKDLSDAPEFEVALQARQAIDRIEQGKESVAPMWKQISGKD
jgi:hypothetical protein